MSLLSIAVVLFLIMDPFGNISSILSLTKDYDSKTQRRIILREMLIALTFMVAFNYLGEFIFYILELNETTVRISSGLVLFLIAIKILFTSPDSPRANLPKGEPFIFPIAIPLICGPGLMATIMLYAHMEPYQSIMILAILMAWVVSAAILYFANPIKNFLGTNGLMAAERLVGMVLILISIQRVMEGLMMFWNTHPHPT